MSQDCERFRRDLAHDAAGELPDEARGEFERHVATCAACRDEKRALRATLDALRSLPDEEPPRDVTAEVMRDLPRRRGLASAYRALGPVGRVAVAALLVVCVGLGAASATKLQVEAQEGRVTIGFGVTARTESSGDTAPWRAAFEDFDTRFAVALEERVSMTEQELSADLSSLLAELYSDIQAERRDDLTMIGQLIVDGHRRDLMQGATDELFMATLAKLSRAEPLVDEERNDENL